MEAEDSGTRDPRAWGALVVAPLILFFPILFDRVPDMRDFPRFVWPARALWRAAILEGRLPQWNPFVGLGAPTLAAPVHGTFYPPNLLLLLGPPVLAMCLLWLAHVVVAGFGGYALARRLGCRAPVAVASGVVWQLGGFATSLWSAGEKVLTCAWVPWATLGLMMLAERDLRRRILAGTAVAFALMALAGDPFIWLDAAVMGLALGWAKGSERDEAWPVARRLALRAAVALVLAGLLAAMALVPALSLLAASERSGGLAQVAAERWSFLPARVIELLLPSNNPMHAEMLITSVYLGLGAVLCAPFAGRRRMTSVLLVLTALALAASFGRHTPVHGVLRAVFPPLRYLRYPEKHLLVVTGCLGLLGAMGAERVLAGRETRRLRYPLAAAAGLLVVALLGALGSSDPGKGSLRVILTGGALAGVLILARRRPAAAWLLPLLVVFDLASAAFSHVSWADARQLREPPPQLGMRAAGAPPPRLYYTPTLDGSLATLPDNLGSPWGIAHLPGFDPGRPGKQRQAWDAVTNQAQRAAALFDVEWLVLPRVPAVPGLQAVAPLGKSATLFHRTPAGRTRVMGRARVVDDATAPTLLGSSGFAPEAEALVAPGKGAAALDGPALGACTHELYAPEHVRLRCLVEGGPALLVQSEAWSPGWQATVDGQPSPIVHAQIAMRGIYLGPGEHVIDQRFQTPGLWSGLLLSLLGLAATLALLRRRKGEEPKATSNAQISLPGTLQPSPDGEPLSLSLPIAHARR